MSTYSVWYEGKRRPAERFTLADELLAVRTQDRVELAQAALTSNARQTLDPFQRVARFEHAGVEVLRTEQTRAKANRDKARTALKQEAAVRFAGRVLCNKQARTPVLYTENLFIKFNAQTSERKCKQILKHHALSLRRALGFCTRGYFVTAEEGTGLDVFGIAEELLKEDQVELCHPELVREAGSRVAMAEQWHLQKTRVSGTLVDQHAAVVEAWSLSEGEGVTIAIIDDGVDQGHPQFQGQDKLVFPRDATRGLDGAEPGPGDNHGTACAGVACANGEGGASGVAPKARLMPIRLASGLGSVNEAEAFYWAARHGADVISCSWGPQDGAWWNDSDPRHGQVTPLPDSTRLAIEWAVTEGRSGRGCVITWAAGNGNESVDHDGYARFDKVIAVGASNDQGTRAAYSDKGRALWCCFPSSHGNPSVTPGIFTTDRRGFAGYNRGTSADGGVTGDHTNSFGGTSSACPGAAGVAALVLARNPSLRWHEVKDILKRSCDPIDAAAGDYDSTGHSPLYGYGRLNARRAVELAQVDVTYTTEHRTLTDVAIQDGQTSTIRVEVADSRPLQALAVDVDIEHTYVGDLTLTLIPPAALGMDPLVLQQRSGGDADNVQKIFDAVTTPELGALAGKSPQGSWSLSVHDSAAQDQGTIKSFGLRLRHE